MDSNEGLAAHLRLTPKLRYATLRPANYCSGGLATVGALPSVLLRITPP